MQTYFKEIRRKPTLSRTEEIVLAQRIQEGDQKALKKLIESNLKLVVTIANKYSGLGMEIEDVVEEGNLGLIEAAKRYKSDQGAKFSTYAGWWIRQSILLAISQKTRHIRLPMNIINEMRQLLGRFEMENITSIDHQLSDEDERTPINFIKTDCEVIKAQDKEHLLHTIKCAMKKLNPRDKEIVFFHFGIDREYSLSRDDIAEKFGMTRTRVNQIIQSSLANMRKEFINS